jgi:hypothetical protein
MAAKKSSTTTKKPTVMSKAAFVRSLAATTPAKEVVAKAKARGMTLTESYVYNVRGAAKAAKRKRTGSLRSALVARSVAATSPATLRSALSTEDLLRAVGAELGLMRAIEVLHAERARVHAVLRS